MGNVFYAACQDPSVLNQFSVLANMKKIEQYRAENSVHHTQPKTDVAAHACFSDVRVCAFTHNHLHSACCCKLYSC